MKQFIYSLDLLSGDHETGILSSEHRTCYSGYHPFRIFPYMGLEHIGFSPITIFYGSNGSGKSTLLNIIAEKTKVVRHSAFSGSPFYERYVEACRIDKDDIPRHSQILTSDDVFDFLLNIRYLNDGIDVRREELFEDYLDRKYRSHRFKSLDDYDEFKENFEAKSKSQSQFVRDRLMRNVDMKSNGESAMRYFVERITENALYLLDEPENSLSISLQMELAKFIEDSAKYYGCQFVIATHSPIMLALNNARIYNLDEYPVSIRKWTELDNVRKYYDFFESHKDEFESN